MRVIDARLRPDEPEDGFTLIELVVSVAILGIITSALFGVVLQYLKTTTDTSARLNESTDQQFISTYWQNDVSSLGSRSLNPTGSLDTASSVFVGGAGPLGCGSSVGAVVVAFAWTQFNTDASNPLTAWDTTPQEAAYVTVPRGSRFVLKRVRCGSSTRADTVAHNLTATPTITCDTACSSAAPLPGRISMTFTVKDADNTSSPGYTTTVTGDRRQG